VTDCLAIRTGGPVSRPRQPRRTGRTCPNPTLADAARLCLISLDATIRSNLAVGLPIDLAALPVGASELSVDTRFDANSPYYQALRAVWQEGLARAFAALPRFEWETP